MSHLIFLLLTLTILAVVEAFPKASPVSANPKTQTSPISEDLVPNPRGQADIISAIKKVEATISASSVKVAPASKSVLPVPAPIAPSAAPSLNCEDGTWELNMANYKKFETDKNLHAWFFGGIGTDGINYPPEHKTWLTENLAYTVEPAGSSLVCTLESHACNPADTCDLFRIRLADKQPGPSTHWGWFAVHSISNVWAFSTSFYTGVTNAGIYTADLNLDLTKVFTKPGKNPEFLTKDILLGFSFVVVVAFNFVPVVGEVVDASLAAGIAGGVGGTVGATISTGGSFLGNTLAAGTEDLATKAADFGAYMGIVFDNTQRAVDLFIKQLMQGANIGGPAGGTPTLLKLLNGGNWVTEKALTDAQTSIPTITTLLQKDFIQRGINHIWLQSKIWVSFVDLQDDASQTRCKSDRNGWQASKTCLHGGIYYLYRFDEEGPQAGKLNYPWGADKMEAAPWNLSPSWVTHSSAMAYRAQNNGAGGFNYDYTKAPSNLPSLFETVGKSHSFDNLNALEGVWNLSVCDMGTHNDWNNDFTSETPLNPQWSPYGLMAFPCCCGPQCSQTKAFIQSAQMNNFQTIFNKCHDQLKACDAWPAGATQVDFGDAGVIEKKNPDDDGNCL